jgi:hypothetical protein
MFCLLSPISTRLHCRTPRVTALGLQLFYLLTPLGTRPEPDSAVGDDAHLTLGAAMQTLHEHPVLNDAHLPGFDADAVLPDFLRDSFEQVKVMLMPVGLDELSKIWSTINQPYRLSVAYEVSLVELTPTPPPPVGGGIVASTGVTVITLDPPRLTKLIPAGGALARIVAGAVTPNELRITGFGLSFPGQTPIVRVGGQPAPIASAPPPTDQALTVALPASLEAGPQVDARVTLNQRTSLPLPFLVSPWLASLTPIRTALEANATLTLHGSGFASPQAVRLDGPGGVTTSITAFQPGGDATQVGVALPAGLVNGLQSVRLVLNDGSATNPRTLEVIPRVDQAAVALVGTVHRVTVTGARLNGASVRLILDGVTYQIGANASASQVVHLLGRRLSPGTHRVAVNIDGCLSHTIELGV